MINKIRRFFEVEIWNVGSHIGGFLGWLLKVLRVFIVSIQDFIEDKCSLRASALTYYSVLSLVPILALFFGIAKGFGLDEKLRVHGIGNLRIADASIFPSIPSGNTNAPAIMVGEMAANIIKNEALMKAKR